MENSRNEQMEALKVLKEFNSKLVGNMKSLVYELSGNRLEDTDELLKANVDALNWEIQVVNQTIEVINDGEEKIRKEDFNHVISMLGEALATKNDLKMAEQFENVIALLEQVGEAIESVC